MKLFPTVFFSFAVLLTGANAESPRRTSQLPQKAEKILVPTLKGVVIATDTRRALAIQREQKAGLVTEGLDSTTNAVIASALRPYLGKPVTKTSLNALRATVERAVAKTVGHRVVCTYPRQVISSGVIAIKLSVFSGKGASNPLANVRALSSITPASSISPGRPIPADWTWLVGVDNKSSESVGDERIFVGANLVNLFNLDHRLLWIATTGFDFEDYHGTSLTYGIPLPRDLTLDFMLSASETHTSTSDNIDDNGRFFSIMPRITMPLPTLNGMEQSLRLGFSFRENTYERLQGNNVANESLRSFQIKPSWDAVIKDSGGVSLLHAGLVWGPGGFATSEDSTYQSLGAESSRHLIMELELARRQKLADFGTLLVRLEGQISSQGLISSDQYYASGASKVRGYDESLVNGDRAIFASLEYRPNAINLANGNSLQPSAFFDAASLSDNGGGGEDIAGIGVGLTWKWKNHLVVRGELAQPLREVRGEGNQPVFHFGITQRW